MNYELFRCTLLKELYTLDSTRNYKVIRAKKGNIYQDFLISPKQGITSGPAIDLQGIYAAHKIEDMDTIARLARIFYTQLRAEELLGNQQDHFETLQDKICCRLVNPQRYDKLQDALHMPYLDLAVIFYLDFDISGADFCSYCVLRNNCLQDWNVTIKDLFDIARKNTLKKNPFKIKTPDEVLRKILPDDMVIRNLLETFFPSDENFFRITCPDGDFGATALLYPELFENIAEKMQCDLSLVLLSENQIMVESLEDLINKQCVLQDMYHASKDIMSDKIYCYRRNTGQISVYLNCNTLFSK